MLLYLGLGSNLGNREENIRRAIELIDERVGRIVSYSSLYETAPVDMDSDRLFLNAAACADTQLPPLEILHVTQQIERELGRHSKSTDGRHDDRIIDIDLLQYGDLNMETAELTLPHPEVPSRRFVVEPLAEIAPNEAWAAPPFTTFAQLRLHLYTADVACVDEATQEDWHDVNLLLEQLSAGRTISWHHYKQLVACQGSTLVCLYGFKEGERRIIGMATLCVTLSPTGCKGRVEDVVIDEAWRGRGLSHLLLATIKAKAAEAGVEKLMLTSRPQRVAANNLYRQEGFEPRETNVYCLTLTGTETACADTPDGCTRHMPCRPFATKPALRR